MTGKMSVLSALMAMAILSGCGAMETSKKYRRLSVDEYVEKMKGGWVGQMAGVGWGEPTEFRYKARTIPENEVPAWKPERVNAFGQDDLYVEMTFLHTLEKYGLDVSIRQAGIDFASSNYPLWHANRAGRDNLRRGIAPPDSGHPAFNEHADDIDYQIEADYSGLISPGLGNAAVELGEKFGRMMNYGDGVYAGQFVGAMYAEAFFEDDMERVVRGALEYIPPQSQYAGCIRDVLKWWKQYPDDWKKTWQQVEAKYHRDPGYYRFRCAEGGKDFNIDAKINGAYIVMGLLYGRGDMDKTIIVSMSCGQDSDCNPSNAAGVLATAIGYDDLDAGFKSALVMDRKFTHTPYDLDNLIRVCQQLARKSVVRQGGRIERDGKGKEVLLIPVQKPRTSRFVQSWDPEPAANSRFTQDQIDRFYYKGSGSESESVSVSVSTSEVFRVGACTSGIRAFLAADILK